jgi:hypothetical protein
MKKLLGFTLLILFITSAFVVAQTQSGVEYDEIDGKLTTSDKFKKDFGRYKGFELPLNKGEMANFAIFSDKFSPKLVLVEPNGKIYKQSGSAQKGMTSILTEIPVSGEWILYVIGGATDSGDFKLRYAFAVPENLKSQNSDMDFCSTLNYLIPHANAYFLMLQAQYLNNSIPQFPSSLSSFIDNASGSYVNIFFRSNVKVLAEGQLISIRDQIINCLQDWKVKNSDWKRIDELIHKTVTFLEPNSKKPIQLILSLLKQQKEKEIDSIYELSLEISKTP